MHYNYVLWCTTDSGAGEFYVGYTTDLKSRLAKHRSGSTKTTKKFRSVRLVYYEVCLSEADARQRELQLKTGFGRGYINRRLRDYLKKRV